MWRAYGTLCLLLPHTTFLELLFIKGESPLIRPPPLPHSLLPDLFLFLFSFPFNPFLGLLPPLFSSACLSAGFSFDDVHRTEIKDSQRG